MSRRPCNRFCQILSKDLCRRFVLTMLWLKLMPYPNRYFLLQVSERLIVPQKRLEEDSKEPSIPTSLGTSPWFNHRHHSQPTRISHFSCPTFLHAFVALFPVVFLTVDWFFYASFHSIDLVSPSNTEHLHWIFFIFTAPLVRSPGRQHPNPKCIV